MYIHGLFLAFILILTVLTQEFAPGSSLLSKLAFNAGYSSFQTKTALIYPLLFLTFKLFISQGIPIKCLLLFWSTC